MSIFGGILGKIFGKKKEAPAQVAPKPATAPAAGQQAPKPAPAAPAR